MLGDENGNQMEDLFYLRLGGRILLQASEQRETFAADTDEDIAADTEIPHEKMNITGVLTETLRTRQASYFHN